MKKVIGAEASAVTAVGCVLMNGVCDLDTTNSRYVVAFNPSTVK